MIKITIGCAALVAALASPALAQTPATPSSGHEHRAAPASSDAPSAAPSAPAGAHGAGMSMDMCKQMMAGHGKQGGEPAQGGGMMSGMMDGGMMGMSGAQAADPRMLEMRGEMMKAMGEVMMKHARKMRGPRAATAPR